MGSNPGYLLKSFLLYQDIYIINGGSVEIEGKISHENIEFTYNENAFLQKLFQPIVICLSSSWKKKYLYGSSFTTCILKHFTIQLLYYSITNSLAILRVHNNAFQKSYIK